jgi:outer membrane biosynthesis protein TonB
MEEARGSNPLRSTLQYLQGKQKSRATIFGMSPGDLLPLALYLVQQLGIMLGVGSATVLLISYLTAMRDGMVEQTEARFARVVQHVLEIGLVCIVLSGAAITAEHAFAGQMEILSSPAYVFKWLLIGSVSLAVVLRRAKPFISAVGEGLVGATWYALFIVHVVAPIAAWTDLLFLYVAWVAGFMLLWISLTKLITARVPQAVSAASAAKPAPITASKLAPPAPKPVQPPPMPKAQQPAPPPPPPMPKPEPKPPVPPVASAPVAAAIPVKPPPPKAAPAPQKPQELVVAQNIPVPALVPQKSTGLIKNTDDTDQIPHVYVMPRTPEDVEKHLRSAELQFV